MRLQQRANRAPRTRAIAQIKSSKELLRLLKASSQSTSKGILACSRCCLTGNYNVSCTCGRCSLTGNHNGLCKRHEEEIDALLEAFLYLSLDVAETFAIPGVTPADTDNQDPFINRAGRFINQAARNFEDDFAKYKNSANAASKEVAA